VHWRRRYLENWRRIRRKLFNIIDADASPEHVGGQQVAGDDDKPEVIDGGNDGGGAGGGSGGGDGR
jgi:hypothetical protein